MRRQKQCELRDQTAESAIHTGLTAVIRETSRLWRRHHLTYDQTKYIVEQARHQLKVQAPARRRRTVQRLERSEVERLVNSAYQDRSQEGLLIKTLFLTGSAAADKPHNQSQRHTQQDARHDREIEREVTTAVHEIARQSPERRESSGETDRYTGGDEQDTGNDEQAAEAHTCSLTRAARRITR
jgi:hypothetical protein